MSDTTDLESLLFRISQTNSVNGVNSTTDQSSTLESPMEIDRGRRGSYFNLPDRSRSATPATATARSPSPAIATLPPKGFVADTFFPSPPLTKSTPGMRPIPITLLVGNQTIVNTFNIPYGLELKVPLFVDVEGQAPAQEIGRINIPAQNVPQNPDD